MQPTEGQIRRVMLETGMGYIQARNHLVCRFKVQQRLLRERQQRG